MLTKLVGIKRPTASYEIYLIIHYLNRIIILHNLVNTAIINYYPTNKHFIPHIIQTGSEVL